MGARTWIVIEGENGTGKDTLSERFIANGWFNASNHPTAITAKASANTLAGTTRLNAFLAYNHSCAKLVAESPTSGLLVRYWPSSLAAAYADGILPWDSFVMGVNRAIGEYPVPALVLFLECRLNARRMRVQQRGSVPGSTDDVSQRRDRAYRQAIEHFTGHPGMTYWRTIQTGDLNAEQVYEVSQTLLRSCSVIS